MTSKIVVTMKKPSPVAEGVPEPLTLLGGARFVESQAPEVPAAEAPGFTDQELGLPDNLPDGSLMTPEGRAALYDRPEVWDHARELAQRVGMVDENALWELARSYRSVYAARWREMLLEDLHRRETDPIGALSSDEKMARGIVRSVIREIDVARQQLQALFDSVKTPETLVIVLRGALVGAKEVLVSLKKGE